MSISADRPVFLLYALLVCLGTGHLITTVWNMHRSCWGQVQVSFLQCLSGLALKIKSPFLPDKWKMGKFGKQDALQNTQHFSRSPLESFHVRTISGFAALCSVLGVCRSGAITSLLQRPAELPSPLSKNHCLVWFSFRPLTLAADIRATGLNSTVLHIHAIERIMWLDPQAEECEHNSESRLKMLPCSILTTYLKNGLCSGTLTS